MRARANLLDSGAALKQMQKIIDAQGPSICRTDLGTLTADVPAPNDGVVSGIDCLRLNRLARTAGAPIDKGAGIKIFKKIGDRVEKGEPLYRIYAFDQSEYDLAVAATKIDTGYVDRWSAIAPRRDEHREQRCPSKACRPSRAMRRGLQSRLGVPMHEIALHRFPDGELRVTVGPAASTTDHLCRRSIGPMTSCSRSCSPPKRLRRDGAKRLVLVAPYLCYMRQDAAFQQGEAISQKVIGRLLAGIVDRVITVDAHLHRTTDIKSVFPGIEADNLSAMPAIADALRAAGFDPEMIVVGPDAESRPWVSDLAGRLGVAHAVAQKDAPRRPFGRNQICRSQNCLPAGRSCWSTILSLQGAR